MPYLLLPSPVLNGGEGIRPRNWMKRTASAGLPAGKTHSSFTLNSTMILEKLLICLKKKKNYETISKGQFGIFLRVGLFKPKFK